ncbi:twin-arginine translocation signal domain-containing protein, partial [Salmonella enterica]
MSISRRSFLQGVGIGW